MKNMKISRRLTIGFGIVLALVLVLAVFSISMILIVDGNYSHLVEYPQEKVVKMTEIEMYFYESMYALSHMSVYSGLPGADVNINRQAELVESYIGKMTAAIGEYIKLVNADGKLAAAEKSENAAAANDILSLIADYRAQIIAPVTLANLEGRTEDVLRLSNGADDMSGKLFDLIDGLRVKALNSSASISNETSRIALMAKIGLGVLSGIIVIVGIVFALIITKSISGSLSDSVGKIGHAVGTVTQSSRELSGASNTISEGAQSQAAAIEQTSATMNETASMIKLTKESTQHAARLSTAAEKNSTESLSNVNRLMEVMGKLNESSSQIAKIADTIDSLASQTNILALNASVEAVRVGEAGKGFAVVAEEVRDLANKSADAARNTTDIIKENISLAMQGVENSKIVNSSLGAIHEDVRQINMLMAEISTASEEQSRGVDQIAGAMSQMEQSTQSNAAVAEQSSAAANELLVISEELSDVTGSLEAMV